MLLEYNLSMKYCCLYWITTPCAIPLQTSGLMLEKLPYYFLPLFYTSFSHFIRCCFVKGCFGWSHDWFRFMCKEGLLHSRGFLRRVEWEHNYFWTIKEREERERAKSKREGRERERGGREVRKTERKRLCWFTVIDWLEITIQTSIKFH